MNMKSVAVLATLTATAAAFAAPVVDDVTMTQETATRCVTITYKLTDEPAIVTFDIRTNGTSIGAANLQTVGGDVNKVVRSLGTTRTITWQPTADWPGHKISDRSVTAVVTAWATNCPPPYMTIDLLNDSTALTPNEGLRFYVSAEAVPGGVSNDVYKTRKLLMRKIPAADIVWRKGPVVSSDYLGMGEYYYKNIWHLSEREPVHVVTLSADYYIGVYPFTQGQYKTLRNAASCPSDFSGYADSDLRPYSGISFGAIRGTNIGDRVPVEDGVDDGSIVKQLRDISQIDSIDLPTEAQWEFACRSGSGKALYSGKDIDCIVSSGSVGSSKNLDELAWYSGNSTNETTDAIAQTHPVGLKLPNAFGIYDMLGNVNEVVLDAWWLPVAGSESVDPISTAKYTPNWRVRKGGSYQEDARFGRSAFRVWTDTPDKTLVGLGFRLACKPIVK